MSNKVVSKRNSSPYQDALPSMAESAGVKRLAIANAETETTWRVVNNLLVRSLQKDLLGKLQKSWK